MDFLAGNRIRGTSTERTSLVGVSGIGGWKEVGRTTLGSKTSPMTVTSLPDKRYYMVLSYAIADGTNRAATTRRLGYNSVDTGSNYSSRRNDNGSLESTNISRQHSDNVNLNTDKTPQFAVDYVSNLSSKEKLAMTQIVLQNTAGAGNAPQRAESVWKWTNTSNPLDTYQILREPSESGSWEAGSEVVVLGWDEDNDGSNFWEELASTTLTSTGDTLSSGTFTAKKYLWVQGYTFGTSGNEAALRVGNNSVDTSSNYTYRYSSNGGSDSTEINKTKLLDLSNQTPIFWNYFIINNAANEKLMIGNVSRQSTAGAGNAPSRMESVEKWANTSNQINIIDFQNTGAGGDMSIGSTIKVWGSN